MNRVLVSARRPTPRPIMCPACWEADEQLSVLFFVNVHTERCKRCGFFRWWSG